MNKEIIPEPNTHFYILRSSLKYEESEISRKMLIVSTSLFFLASVLKCLLLHSPETAFRKVTRNYNLPKVLLQGIWHLTLSSTSSCILSFFQHLWCCCCCGIVFCCFFSFFHSYRKYQYPVFHTWSFFFFFSAERNHEYTVWTKSCVPNSRHCELILAIFSHPWCYPRILKIASGNYQMIRVHIWEENFSPLLFYISISD